MMKHSRTSVQDAVSPSYTRDLQAAMAHVFPARFFTNLSPQPGRTRRWTAQAGRFYRPRWGWRWPTATWQTLSKRKLASGAQTTAAMELDWAVLQIVGQQALVTAGADPLRLSLTQVRTRVRQAMRRPRARGLTASLGRQLARAARDDYL